jgi:hypothetical protein
MGCSGRQLRRAPVRRGILVGKADIPRQGLVEPTTPRDVTFEISQDLKAESEV